MLSRINRRQTLTGIILAGGQSRRMGRHKPFIRAGGIPLFERVYRVLHQIFSNITVVTNDPEEFRFYDVRILCDLIPNGGSLGGLYTGLMDAQSDQVFCFASDMPFLNPGLIRYMMGKSHQGDVIIPRTSEGVQPLHAIYAKTCLAPIENLMSRGNLKIIDFFQEVTVSYILEKEILRYDPMLTCFLNVNTDEDLQHVENLLSKGLCETV
jgi:molybdopterin-guanine dinucleotide biosynthesis protein A